MSPVRCSYQNISVDTILTCSADTTITLSHDATIRKLFEKRWHIHLHYLLQQTNAGAPALVKYCNHRWNQRRSKSYALQNFGAIRQFMVYSL